MLRILYTTAFLLLTFNLFGQRGNWQSIPLEDLSAFQKQAGNWSIVSDVQMDPDLSVRKKPNPEPEQATRSKRRKKKKRRKHQNLSTTPPTPITWEAGSGILLNMNTDSLRDHLLTTWQHGDLELEIEVMVPKGSNSGIYFQGRYEIQILDSYGKQNPKFGDMGGIYRKWGDNPPGVYMGKPPFVNAAKAPGLWQTFKIGFQAPKFDAKGQKIANAKFVYVDLNGVRIHQNVEVPFATRASMSNKEVPLGPLMIQGDHGPVAFRNIRYRPLTPSNLSIEDITYQVYKGTFTSIEGLDSLEKVSEGTQNVITSQIEGLEVPFTVVYQANLTSNTPGDHLLRLTSMGNYQFDMGGKTIGSHVSKQKWKIDHTATLALNLQQGDNLFTLIYHKANPRFAPGLALFNLDSYPIALHDYPSYTPKPKTQVPIELEVLGRTRLLRGFLRFKKGPAKTLTHTIAVGTPQGVHFVYDLQTGTPACVWRGPFMDAAPMWVERAGNPFKPLGAVQYLFSGLSIAFLPDSSSPFPSNMNEQAGFHNEGYTIDPTTGIPSFLYTINDLPIVDRLVPDKSGHGVVRKVSFESSSAPQDLYLKLGEGQEIRKLSAQRYLVDQQYYLNIPAGQEVILRQLGEQTELVAPITSGTFTYSIIW